VHVIVRTRYLAERLELMELGANEVIPEEFETSIEIFSRVLKRLRVPRGNIAAQAAMIRREGYQLLREDLGPARELEMLQEVLAETGVDTVLVPSHSHAVGRSLKELDIRARTGASIVSVVRNGAPLPVPDPHVRLEPNDVLFVVGMHEAIDRLREFVTEGLTPEA
jgi:CPA2 family monovalent cation:H+ antiporter-2